MDSAKSLYSVAYYANFDLLIISKSHNLIVLACNSTTIYTYLLKLISIQCLKSIAIKVAVIVKNSKLFKYGYYVKDTSAKVFAGACCHIYSFTFLNQMHTGHRLVHA